jgi:hypothetical protein
MDHLATALSQPASFENPLDPQLLELANPEVPAPTQKSDTTSRKRARPSNGRSLPRSHTWSGDTSQLSDAPTPAPGEENSGRQSQPRSGTGQSRKKNIQIKAASSIAAGLMPTFCSNCGEIETSTWRKAYARTETGSPADHSLASAVKDGIVGFEMLDAGEGEDAPAKYRIFKQSVSVDEKDLKGFEVLMLCNPCGLWFNKRGSMRPQEIWMRQAVDPANKPKRNRKKSNKTAQEKKGQGQDVSMSDAMQEPFSTGVTEPCMQSDGAQAFPFPPQQTTESTDDSGNRDPLSLDGTLDAKPSAPQSGAKNQMDAAAAEAALLRAIQSSPVRFHGTKYSPIELETELTPRPTRRILFPSPRKDGEVRSLGNCPDKTSQIPKEVASDPTSENVASTLAQDNAEVLDKENCPPALDENDDLAHLFEDMANHLQETPKSGHSCSDLLRTPTPKSGRQSGTPRRTQSDLAGLTTPSRSARGPLAPVTPFTAQLNAIMSGGITGSSPLQLQSINYSDLGIFNTPGRNTSAIQFNDWATDDFLSSDLPMPSSPPAGMFSLYEDPATSTQGFWDRSSIFGSNDSIHQDATGSGQGQGSASKEQDRLDLSAIIEEVAGSKKSADEQPTDGASAAAEA